MNNRATYSCTALMGTNKTGILKPDEAGYYPLVLGAFDVYNSGGAWYPLAPAKDVIENSVHFNRRIQGGNLRAELGHPKMLPGMSDRDFLSRVLQIYEENVCAHIREVTIVENVRDQQGRATIAVIGQVKPSGPHASVLKASLDNPHENVCFSIRSLTEDIYQGGRMVKNIRQIVTWDYVTEPGIAIANKFAAPTLEALGELSVNPAMLAGLKATMARQSGMGFENQFAINAEDIEEAFGWKKGILSLPVSTKW